MRAVTGVKLFPTPGRRLRLLLGLLVLFGSGCFRCEAQRLAQQEVTVLGQIASKLRKKWDFTVDPCSGAAGWADPQSSNTSFVFNSLTCDCNATTNICHVTSILLKGQNLTGVLPDEFANLTSLRVIDLTRNYLSGPIPVAWASLPLTNLSLQGNRISGIIPKELGSITTLQLLHLEANLLQGQIPAALGNLVNLERFLASSNYFTGELPESLGNLKNMTDFRINGNAISGKIPSFIGKWTKLQKLHMLGTSLEGPFPQNFVTLESINELVVSDLKGGDGKFPPLQNMRQMQELVLRNLSISGELPNFFGGMNDLKKLDLSFNNLTGSIPSSFDGLSSTLTYMFLTNNMLSGTIPDGILSRNWNLDLSYNNFTGLPAPSNCQLGSVNLVSSYSPTASNSIKTCFRRNNPCPQEAKNYNLFINCGGNKVNIDGNEYEEDTEQQGASRYVVSDSEKWAYSCTGYYQGGNVKAQYVTTNASLLNMTNQELYMTARLSSLSLRYYGLCLQTGNYSVKLHFAEIMFTDDETFYSVGKRLFDVYIQGKKVLQDFNIAKEANGTGKEITRNFTATVDGTLEIHFQWVGKGTSSIPLRGVYGPLISAISVTPNFDPKIDGNKLSLGAILGIVAASCVVIVSILVMCWFFCRRKDDENSELRGLELQTGYFSLKQIKVATKNFDPANQIGEGGFGPVYMGVMPDGSAIAVKQLSSKSMQGNREFLNEIGMISALHHPNLVKLFGCCVEGSQLLLIYEYMENNSLARALFGPERNRLSLDWQTRRKICLGIARGLSYLHEESRLKIVHRDIKATNVLLDKELNAKISDFGLARLDDKENSHISTRIAGTIGYMAPEYAMRGYLTDKADVYSFGVVTLEIVSGMSNTNYRPKEDCVYLLDSAYVLQEQGSLLELVDPNLGSNYSKDEALQMLNLALICTKPSPTLRPPMSAVVSMLDGRTPLQIPSVKPGASRSEEMRFKAFERLSHDSRTQSISTDRLSHDGRTQNISTDRLSHDSRTQSISTDGPWVDSSVSVPSSKASTSYSAEIKLLPELTE